MKQAKPSTHLEFDRTLWDRLSAEILRYEVERPGWKENATQADRNERRTNRRIRERLVWEAMDAGIPTGVIAAELGMTVEGVRRRAKRHSEFTGREMPRPGRTVRHEATRSYSALVDDYGALYDAWHEPLDVVRRLGSSVQQDEVAYYARQGGLTYSAIAAGLGLDISWVRDRIHRFAEAKDKAEPRKRPAVTARPGERGVIKAGAEPPEWLLEKVRRL